MSQANESSTSKFLGEDGDGDFLNSSQFEKNLPKDANPQKRSKRPDTPIPGRAIEEYQADVKKRKISQNLSMDADDFLQKVQGAVAKQIESRQQCNDLMLNNLWEILSHIDSEYSTMRENQDNLEQLAGALLKSIQQYNAAQKQKLKLLWEIPAAFRKGWEDMIKLHKEQNEKLIEDVEGDLKILEQKIITKTKQNLRDKMYNTFFQAMQNDF